MPGPKLALHYAPFGMRLPDAAAYCGVSPTKFLEWVRDRAMPQPLKGHRVRLWLRPELEAALIKMSEHPAAIVSGAVEEPKTGWEDVL